MQKIGESTLWEHKFRPQCIEDLILPDTIRSYFLNLKKNKDIPNILLHGPAGTGKTTVAYAVCNDTESEIKYINGSLQTSIDMLRDVVMGYASSSSMFGGKKIVILDECEMLSSNALLAMKGICDKVEKNCRFIFTTNNLARIKQYTETKESESPLLSRFDVFSFDFPTDQAQQLMFAYYKRICWILEQEGVKYNKETIAEFVKNGYPDFRNILNSLQKCSRMFEVLDKRILSVSNTGKIENLILEIKAKNFNTIRKLCSEVNPEQFFPEFYSTMDDNLENECKPNVILTLAEYARDHSISVDKEINLAACCLTLVKECKWK